ncbi:MAG: hypothetical protein DRJ15_08745 [Bacteroidetes bacterium]|nr:MAG: hypothetical protein DRJ15_08745 [Bacteroidota bacterium]
MTQKQKSVHDERTRILSLKPQIIGLENILASTGEVNLFGARGTITSQPDTLHFDASTQTLYLTEYKTHHTKSNSHHAKYQLNKSYNVLKRVFPDWNIKKLYITDNYKVEVVR